MMNIELSAFLSREAAGNSVQAYLTALLIFLGVLAALYAARAVLLSHLRKLAEKTVTDLDDFLVGLLYKLRTPEYQLFAFYIATRSLRLNAGLDKTIHIVFVLALSYRAVTMIQAAAAYGLRKEVLSDICEKVLGLTLPWWGKR